MRRALFFLPILLFVVVAGYFALSLRPGRDPQALPSAMIDKEAPAFDLAGLDGGTGLARDALKGHVVLINFFASWCVPCRTEQPMLMRLAEREHLPLYGIDYKDKPEAAQQLLAQFGNPYRGVGVDRDGRIAIDFGVYGVPETYVIDKGGRIRFRYAGPLTIEVVEGQLLPLVKALERS
jgi:cytochrome c biogenesis protein CcmG/thiol:disulfide interchange protein DsbE